MPWLLQAKKDATSCEKLRGARRIVGGPTRGTETSHYPEEKKITMIPPVAASERGGAQTGGVFGPWPGL